MKVPFCQIARDQAPFEDELLAAAARVVRGGRWIGGPEVEALERELGAFAGREAVACASGTDALVLALKAAGVGPGDKVVVPAFSFAASAGAVVLAGALPVFADVDEETFQVSPATLEPVLAPDVRALVAVSLFGRAAPCRGLGEVLRGAAPAAALVEDAAQSFGALRGGERSCALSPYAATSFYPTKPFGGFGDGGMVFLEAPAAAAEVRVLCDHGQTRRDHCERTGTNSRLDAIQAAMLRVKFRRFAALKKLRAAAAERYETLLSGAARRGLLRLPGADADESPVWAQYVVRIPSRGDSPERRDALRRALAADGIETAVHYSEPLHLQPAFARLDPGARCPAAERLAREVLGLPIGPSLSPEEQEYVAERLVARLETL